MRWKQPGPSSSVILERSGVPSVLEVELQPLEIEIRDYWTSILIIFISFSELGGLSHKLNGLG